MAYDDIFGIHYVTSYGRENASYNLTTKVEGNVSITFDSQKDTYSLGENFNLITETKNTDNLLGCWGSSNRKDIKIESNLLGIC